MGEEVAVAGREDEAAAQLKRVLTRSVLAVAGGAGSPAGDEIVEAEEVKNRGVLQSGGAVGFALLVNEQRERDAGGFAEELRVAHVAEADGRETRALCLKF